jgi:hypothetical protein
MRLLQRIALAGLIVASLSTGIAQADTLPPGVDTPLPPGVSDRLIEYINGSVFTIDITGSPFTATVFNKPNAAIVLLDADGTISDILTVLHTIEGPPNQDTPDILTFTENGQASLLTGLDPSIIHYIQETSDHPIEITQFIANDPGEQDFIQSAEEPHATPEPDSLPLMGLGLAALCGLSYVSRKRSVAGV